MYIFALFSLIGICTFASTTQTFLNNWLNRHQKGKCLCLLCSHSNSQEWFWKCKQMKSKPLSAKTKCATKVVFILERTWLNLIWIGFKLKTLVHKPQNKVKTLFEQNLIHSSMPISDVLGNRKSVPRVGHKQALPQAGFFPLSKSDQKLWATLSTYSPQIKMQNVAVKTRENMQRCYMLCMPLT